MVVMELQKYGGFVADGGGGGVKMGERAALFIGSRPGTQPFKFISCLGQDDPVMVIPHNIFQCLLTRLLLTKM